MLNPPPPLLTGFWAPAHLHDNDNDDDDGGGGGDVHDHEDDRYHVTFSWLPARSNVGFAANML